MVQRDVDVTALGVIVAADIVSDPSVFRRVRGPCVVAIAWRFGKRHLAQFNDKRVAARRVCGMLFAGGRLGDAELHMRRIRIEPATATNRHGANAPHCVCDIRRRVSAEGDKVGHRDRLVFEADNLHLHRCRICLHPERDARLEP